MALMFQDLSPSVTESRRRWKAALLATPVVLYPATASANMGTPLMWAGSLHMLIGNLFIGIFEGLLLSWIFKTHRGASIGVMILANYLSAWLGIGILGNFHPSEPLSLSNAMSWLGLMVGLTYVMTLLLEWPFVVWMFRGTPHQLGRSIRASLLVQTVSYALLCAYYGSAGHMSLYTRTELVNASALSLPEHVMVYYLSCDDGDVYRRSLSGGKPVKVMELDSKSVVDRLFVCRNAERPAEWDLVARLEAPRGGQVELVTVVPNLKATVAPGIRARNEELGLEGRIWENVGEVDKLGDPTSGRWSFRTGYWAGDGLKGVDSASGERWKLAFETPFVGLPVLNAVQLPGDKVLFQLGSSEIYLLDAPTRRLALLWKGRGPVAMLGTADGKMDPEVAGSSAEGTAAQR
ncbi:hypothetical protein DES53_106348 [Roseimicrobium gellanilyticum]|uniref:Uncharacterized protein n=2 Tax=Roseimicrobium gellanilyticum TaxID=748857 RepID=A0A366HKT8_9BACT|nr:hypothetical protein DES53_106348 [Roseimicrobium gellanilyticum]